LANLSIIELQNNQLQHLHRVTFKENLKLADINLARNKLASIHAQMFAHLSGLYYLDLSGNACINKKFDPVTSLAAVENELVACGANYPASITKQLSLESLK
jgi:hypothetical protein